jgi:hypothetical protein
LLRFAPGQRGVCNLSDVPVDPTIWECINVDSGDPGKHNIVTTLAQPLVETTAVIGITAEQVKTLNEAKAADALRMVHHFRVLTANKLWEAVRVAQATAQALTKEYARPAAMKCTHECKLAPR